MYIRREVFASRPRDYLTVGFHNFNLRIFDLRVSNPNKLIVDVFLDTMSDFNVPGSRPEKHDEISEIDRTESSPLGWQAGCLRV